MAFLIIDGHGQTDRGNSFDFRRSDATKCTLYSYTFEGINILVTRHNRVIQSAILGQSVDGWAQRNDSRIGGTFITDRILGSIDLVGTPPQPQWVTPRPAGAQYQRIMMGAGANVPVEVYSLPAGNVHNAATVVMFITPGDPHTLRLSEILAYFNQNSYTVIWAPCRGY